MKDDPEIIGALTVENVVIFHSLKPPHVQSMECRGEGREDTLYSNATQEKQYVC